MNNIKVKGSGNAVITGNATDRFVISKVTGVEFSNLKFSNFHSFEVLDGNNLQFANCSFTNFSTNGIVMEDCSSITISNCSISNMGNVSVNETSQGFGVYSYNGSNIQITGSEISYTYGHGAIFLSKTSFTVSNNTIHDTAYRGVETLDTGVSGIISGNNIYNCGTINHTRSGVACNGIFATDYAYNVDVVGNTISNVYENAIEGVFRSVTDNTIDGTGTDPSGHPTPSTEGIYIYEGGTYLRNTIRNTAGPAFKSYTPQTMTGVTIKDNTIYKSGSNDYAIDLISDTGYANITITGNRYSTSECAHIRNKPASNVIVKDNVKF